jgi:Skp family chaperone for outer membrane proteins
MSEKRSFEDRIAELTKKQEQLEARKKALKAKQGQAERKARTKRLIEIGGAVESVLGRPIEKQDLPKLIAFLKQQEERGSFFSNAMNSAPADDHLP